MPPTHTIHSVDALQAVVTSAANDGRGLEPVGGGTALRFGLPLREPVETVSLSGLSNVVDFPSGDLTITVQAGMTVAELQRVLSEKGLMLPVDVPQPALATIGGIIAADTSGSRRFGYGTLRDAVIGIAGVDGTGALFHAGGRVVKNVAGYDLCKLMVGSWGTLGVLTEVTFKLQPLRPTSGFVEAVLDDPRDLDLALESMLTSDTRPISVDVFPPSSSPFPTSYEEDTAQDEWQLLVGFEDDEESLSWQLMQLRQELGLLSPVQLGIVDRSAREDGMDAVALRKLLTDRTTPNDAVCSFTASVLPSRAIDVLEAVSERGWRCLSHAANGIIHARRSREDVKATDFHAIRTLTDDADGSLVVTDCPADWKTPELVFGPSQPEWELSGRVKNALDPQQVLSPGRFPYG